MWREGRVLARARGVTSDLDLGPVVDPALPFAGDLALRTRLQHMYDAGAWVLMESAIADLPADLRWLFESGAVTLPQLADIHRMTSATSAADIAAALEDGTLRTIAGIDDSSADRISNALPTLRAGLPRIPLGRALDIVDGIVSRIATVSGIDWTQPVGSLRRGDETVGDVDIVVSSTRPSSVAEAIDEIGRAHV